MHAVLPIRALRRALCACALLLTILAVPASAAQDYTVRLYDDGFWPAVLTIDAGDTVHFDNRTSANWSVTSGKGLFDSKALAAGGAYSMTLSVPGVHAYHSTGPTGGEGQIVVRGTKLGGKPTDEAVTRIPDVEFPTPNADSVGTHPTLAVKASRTRIMLGFEPGATVEQVNKALADADVTIIGGKPSLGMLLVETREAGWFGDFATLDAALASLRTAPGVLYAAMSTTAQGAAIPRKADPATEGTAPGWDWSDPGPKGNWGLAGAQFTEAWNLTEQLKRKNPKTITGIVDVGFDAEHPDLKDILQVQTQLCPAGGDCQAIGNSSDVHGNHVAGIIGAAYDNDAEETGRSQGVSGGNPVAKMYGYSSAGFSGGFSGDPTVEGATVTDKQIELLDLVLRSRPADLRVINHSMTGVDFDPGQWLAKYGAKSCGPGAADDDLKDATQPCLPDNLDAWQKEIANIGMAASSVLRTAAQQGVLIVQAAGNDGYSFCGHQLCPGSYNASAAYPISAAANTEIGWAAAHWDDNILVGQGLPNPVITVSAADRTGAPRFDSAVGADIMAPGDDILSTGDDDDYVKLGGTSMAAPQVSALAGLLLADNPALSLGALRQRIIDWADGRPGAGNTLNFTYTLADRMNRDDNGDGLVDYAPIGHSLTPERFNVDLDACGAGVGGKTIGTYTWKVGGATVASTSSCRFRWRAPAEGSYTVSLTAQGAGGVEETVTQTVKVEDIVIVSVGDSIASGEGVPDIPDPVGPGGATWQWERCHRSALGGPAQAARRIERSDDLSSVTFLHLACSGARMRGDYIAGSNPPKTKPGVLGVGGLLTGYEGVTQNSETSPCAVQGRTDYTICEFPQLQRAKDLLGTRQPDVLTVSIGANDMRFSTILKACMLQTETCLTSADGIQLFEERIQLLELRYAEVAAKIHELWPDFDQKNVIITQYPDPTTDETGQVSMSCGLASGVSQEEAEWAHNMVVPALNEQVALAASRHGWTLADGIPEEFVGHGYCSSDSWVVDVSGSFWDQFDQNGGFHPKVPGHDAYARHIVEAMEEIDVAPLPHGPAAPRDTAPRLDAYRSLAAGGSARRFADVNDPSRDGNRRIERTAGEDGTIAESTDTRAGVAPGEKTAPDGRVDMRDLRRYRDAWLASCLAAEPGDGCPAASDITLDGEGTHPKRDLNFDGCVTGGADACAAPEHVFSRFDFNGDQILDPAKKSLTPWKEDGAPATARRDGLVMSDVDVMKAGWLDGSESAEGWKKTDLEPLMKSADVEVQAEAVLDTGASKAELTLRKAGGAQVGPKRTIRRRNGSIVMTAPISAPGEQFELHATASSASGEQSSTSAPFGLEYGQDKLIAVCPDVSLKANPQTVPADGTSTTVITATVHRCAGREVANLPVTYTLEPASGSGTLTDITPTTDASGKSQVLYTAANVEGEYTVKASVDMGEDAEPLTAELVIQTVPKVQIKYVWQQTIEQWNESGTTRWGLNDPLKPDCTLTGFDYCMDTFNVGLHSQTGDGIRRAGTLTGGGSTFKLTEQVTNSEAWSKSTWKLSFQDERQPEDGLKYVSWLVTDPTAYTNKQLDGLNAVDNETGLHLNGLQAVGDLPYHYQLTHQGGTSGIDPIEGHSANSATFLIPQGGDRKIRFAAQPEKLVSFPKTEEGFAPYTSCGVLVEDLQTEPGYYVQGSSDYIPGATTIGRKTTWSPGDRPLPVGPSQLKVRYSFAAVAAYEGETVADPVLPDCTAPNPPVAALQVTEPEAGKKEGRSIAFRDASTDPDNDIVKSEWDFGDGKTGTGVEPHHIYDDNGTYTVKLTVTDKEGHTDTDEQEVVIANEPPEAEIDEVTAGTGTLRITYRTLDPGTTDKKNLSVKITSTNPAFPPVSETDHAGVWWRGPYTDLPAGTYPLQLTVTDKDGESATAEAVAVVIDGTPPPLPPAITTTYATCVPTVKLDREERDFLDLINEYREKNGLPALEVSATLTKASDRHTDDMAAKDFMAHTGSDGSDPGKRAWDSGYPKSFGVGENLAETETADESLWAWRGSSTGHNENMLNPSWRAIGISRKKGSKWRWATKFGTGVDCPNTAPSKDPVTPLAPTKSAGGVEVNSVAGDPARETEADAAPAAEPVVPVEFAPATKADAPPAEALYAPTVAFAIKEENARVGRTFELANRSRDGAGTPMAATVDFDDGTTPVVLGPDAATNHVYPASEQWSSFELKATATDAANRVSLVERWIDVWPDDPPDIWIRTVDGQIAVADANYDVKVDVTDPRNSQPLEGVELTFKMGDSTATATTNAIGQAIGKLKLPDVDGWQTLEVSSKETPEFKAATETKQIEVKKNTPPTAKAGGPYVIGEGGTLLLNGSRSSDPDPISFDKLVKWEWDLDGDGAFDDASGRLPAAIEADDLDVFCGGDCAPGTEYPVKLRVTDSWGATHVDTTTLEFIADFDLNIIGGTKIVVPGQSNSYAVNVIGSESYKKPVALSVVGLPAGITASFSKPSVTPTDTSILTLTANANLTQGGTWNVTVQGKDADGLTRTVSDEVKLTFALIPECKGAIGGVVKHRETGLPVAGVTVSLPQVASDTTDADGRYFIDEVPLGYNSNAPQQYTVNASKTLHWPTNGDVTASCGTVAERDLTILDRRKATVNGKVVDSVTKKPINGATLTEEVCDDYSCQSKITQTTNLSGEFVSTPQLGFNNEARGWGGRADAAGYWYKDAYASISPTQPANVLYQLVKKCSATIDGGVVLDYDTKQPIEGAGVGLYLNGYSTPDFTTKSDKNGLFTFNKTAELGYENGARSVMAYPTPPNTLPFGATGFHGYFNLSKCGESARVELYIKVPKRNYGDLAGKVVDEETGLGVPGVDIDVCASCPSDETDANGNYLIEDIYVGNDSDTSNFVTASASLSGYYGSSTNATVVADKVTTAATIKILKKRKGALKFTVTDQVTGAPIPGAKVSDGCWQYCFYADRNGQIDASNLELNNRNADKTIVLDVEREGYWLQKKTVTLKADQTTTTSAALQAECEPARISGNVIDASTGLPLENVNVGTFGNSDLTDVKGDFLIENIKPGTGNNPREITITASKFGYLTQSKDVTIFCGAKLVIDFGTGNTKTGTLVGTVTDEATGQPIPNAFVATEFGKTTQTDGSGNYSFTGVPLSEGDLPREWAVSVQTTGFKPQTKKVTVPAETPARADFSFSTANVAPAADAKTVTTDEDSYVQFGVTGSDADGDNLTYHVMKYPQHGTLSGKAPNFTYTPDSQYNGPDTLEFITNDSVASSQKAVVQLNVTPVNDAPGAVDDYYESVPNTEMRIPVADLVANDIEVDDEPIVITSVEPNKEGSTVEIVGDEVVFNPPKDLDSDIQFAMFRYTITDQAGMTDWAWVYIRVKSGPVAPTCVGKTYTTAVDTPLSDSVACTDANGDAMTHSVVAQPSQGNVAMAADGTFTYTPPSGFVGTTTFTYKATDGALESAVTTATVKVLPPNALPACADLSIEVSEDGEQEIDFSCTDPDEDAVVVTPATQPAHGTLTALAGGKYRYAPAKDYSGADTFTYRGNDGKGNSPAATVAVTVKPVNDVPACVEVTGSGDEDASIDLVPTCTDVDGDKLTLSVAGEPAHGSVADLGDGKLRYTPAKDYAGADGFDFRAADGAGQSPVAKAKLTVNPVNDLPVCADVKLRSTGGPADVAPDCSDVDKDGLTYEIVDAAAKGTASVADGLLRFAPAAGASGEDTFTYRAKDGAGASAVAKVAVTIAENRAPVAGGDTIATDEDAAIKIPVADLLAGDSDADGDALSVVAVDEASHGTVEVEESTGLLPDAGTGPADGDGKPGPDDETRAGAPVASVTFKPDANYHGPAGFRYTVSDPFGATASGMVTVNVRSVNDVPVAGEDNASTSGTTPVTVPLATLLANDTDADGDALSVASVGQAEHGTVKLDGAGATFAAASGFTGIASFKYAVADGAGGTAVGTVKVGVGEVKGTQQLFECADTPVVLEDVVPVGKKVQLMGIVAPSNKGKTVELRQLPGNKVVARPVVDARGRFAATVKMPKGKPSSKTRYSAVLAGKSSRVLKLWRRMIVSKVSVQPTKVVITGKVEGPFAKKAADRVIEVREQAVCADGKVIASVMPSKDGRFKVEVPRRPDQLGAVYRLSAKVPANKKSSKLFPTFTLPRAVDF